MGPRPKGFTIDRIDVNGNYEPGNCRWANGQIQSRNRRDRYVVEYEGVIYTLTDLANLRGLSLQSLHYFYRTRGLPIEQAVARAGKRE